MDYERQDRKFYIYTSSISLKKYIQKTGRIHYELIKTTQKILWKRLPNHSFTDEEISKIAELTGKIYPVLTAIILKSEQEK